MTLERALTITNRIGELGKAFDLIESLAEECGMPQDAQYKVKLAVDEAVTNVIRHGYQDGELHPIRLRLAVSGGECKITVEDEGVPFNPLEHPEPDLTKPIEERPIGGLGVFLVRQLMEDVRYERDGGVNRLTMRASF